MKKLILGTTLTVFLLVFIVPGVLALGIKYVPFADQPGYNPDNKRGLYGKLEAVQTFRSGAGGLTGVGLSIGNPNLKNKRDVVLSLYEGENLIREVRINGQNIPDGSLVRFIFDPISDSLNKKYSFRLVTPGAGEEEIISLPISENPPDWIGDLVYQDEVLKGGLPIVTYHKPRSRFQIVLDIYTNLLSRLLPLRSQRPGSNL